ncbi:hypothetical protein [Alcaligenes faecalis]|uniref:Uncharacterized protein n=1 Tax=Alcaligenes faecalis TaxID=511 RepID=A0ABY7N4R7_ALCFA|nr:hypothetical protein [Alcaligenes faecalis]WBM38358.1 hypothetical protein M2J83_00540 [Alcaligenes faecalis]
MAPNYPALAQHSGALSSSGTPVPISFFAPEKHGRQILGITPDTLHIHAIWQLIFSHSTILIFISKSKE